MFNKFNMLRIFDRWYQKTTGKDCMKYLIQKNHMVGERSENIIKIKE